MRSRETDARSGAIYVFAVVVMSLLLVLGLSLVERASLQSSVGQGEWVRRRAFYAAQAGAEHGKKRLLENPKWTSPLAAEFDDGTRYSVTFADNPPPGPGKREVVISSIGQDGTTSRLVKETVQVAGSYADILYDASPNLNNGRLKQFDLGSCWVPSRTGFANCLQFDGADDHVNVPHDPSLDGGVAGSGSLQNLLSNSEFNDSTAWTFADWLDSTSVCSQSILASGGNPAGCGKVSIAAGRQEVTASGMVVQAISIPETPSQCQLTFDWTWKVFSTGNPSSVWASGTFVRAYLDSAPGDATNQIWNWTPSSLSARPWETVGPLDVSSLVTAPGSYYLKLIGSAHSQYWTIEYLVDNVKLEVPTAGAGAAQRTIEAWVHPASLRSMPILSKAGSFGLDLVQVSTSLQARAWFAIGGTVRALVSADTVPVGTWTHVAGSYDGSKMTIYVNGLPSGELAVVGSIGAPVEPFIIGADRPPPTLPFTDGFESGALGVGGWDPLVSNAAVVNDKAHTGTFSVRFARYQSLRKALNTDGHTGIVVEAWVETLDAGDSMGLRADDVYIRYSIDGGNSWWSVGTFGETSTPWSLRSWQLPAGVNNQSDLHIGLFHAASTAGDRAWIDDVRIYSTTGPPSPVYFAGKLDEIRISGVARTSFPLTQYEPDATTSALWHCEPPEGGSGISVTTVDWE